MTLPGAQHTQALLGAGQPRFLPALSTLCEEGQVTACFFVVTAGNFVIVKRLSSGQTALWNVGPGSVLALMPAFDGAPCAVTITALDDATVVEITRESLLDLLGSNGHPNLELANLLSLLAIRRLRQATNELAQALVCALQSTEHPGRIDAVRLARIQAASYVWQDA